MATEQPLQDVLLTTTVVSALELAAAHRRGRPVTTVGILSALIADDAIGAWETVQLRSTYLLPVEPHSHPDPEPVEAGRWSNVPLTKTATDALRTAASIARAYRLLPMPPGVLAVGLLASEATGASRALLQACDLTHEELLELVQDEILGTTLEGIATTLDRTRVSGPAVPATTTYAPTTVAGETLAPLPDAVPWIAAPAGDAAAGATGPTRTLPPGLLEALRLDASDVEPLVVPDHPLEPVVLRCEGRLIKAYDLRSLDDDERDRIRAGLTLAASVSGLPGVVPATAPVDCGAWLVTESPVMGPSLRSHIDRVGIGEEQRHAAEVYADEIARTAWTLQRLHDRGLVHRAVQPESLVADPHERRLALADFAVAARAVERRRTLTRRAPERTRYVAPERFEGESGPAVDQYALGVVAREVLTMPGSPPLTAPVHEVLEKATAPRPEDRFATIATFGEALRRAVRLEAPRGIADRYAAMAPHRRAAVTPTIAAAVGGVLVISIAATHDTGNPSIAESLLLAALGLGGVGLLTFYALWVAGAVRGQRRRFSVPYARLRWVTPVVGTVVFIAEAVFGDSSGLVARAFVAYLSAMSLRALLAPAPVLPDGLLFRVLRAWDRHKVIPRRRRLITVAATALVAAAVCGPLMGSRLFRNQPPRPARSLSPFVAVWNLRASAGARAPDQACGTVVRLRQPLGAASCHDLLDFAGYMERSEPSAGPVFGQKRTLDTFTVEATPAPPGVLLWRLHPPGSRDDAGALYTTNPAYTAAVVTIVRGRPQVGLTKSSWLYDLAVIDGRWRVTGFRACTVVGPGEGRRPAQCQVTEATSAQILRGLLRKLHRKDGTR